MQKVRVKVYGLFALTKRTYLVVQCLGLGLVVVVFALGLCLPRPKPARGEPLPPLAVAVVRLLDGLPWLALLFLLAGAAETWIVLKKFARKEAEHRSASGAA
ncbi:MAG: hypothetical protein HYS12_07320 [Planctomycetes bacterium]|nr:hypothetical protein [Planctomycetota bacterium]